MENKNHGTDLIGSHKELIIENDDEEEIFDYVNENTISKE